MFARFGAILTLSLRAGRRRAGFHAYGHPGLYCGDLLTHRVIYNPHVHTAEALLTIARSLEEPAVHVPMGKVPLHRRRTPEPAAAPARGPAASRRRAARQQILGAPRRERPAIAGKRLIVVNPNASQLIPIRRWPHRVVRGACGEVRGRSGERVRVDGNGRRAGRHAIHRRPGQERSVVDLAGKTSVRISWTCTTWPTCW